MAHEIETAMFSRKPAWHGLGIVTDDAPNIHEAIRISGLDWRVEQEPIYYERPDDSGDPTFFNLGSHVINVRSTDRRILGVVGSGYEPLQNEDAFQFLDGLLDDGEIKIESAGSLKGGRLVWMLAQCEGLKFSVDKAGRDEHLTYMLITTAHNGSSSVRIMPTTVRVVCWNTLSLAVGEGRRKKEMISLRHTSQLSANLDRTQKTLKMMARSIEQYKEFAADMYRFQMTEPKMLDLVRSALAVPEDADEKVLKRFEKREKAILEISQNDLRATLFGAKGTLWGGLQAITQWVDHEIPVRAENDRLRNENRMMAVIFGEGHNIKERAFNRARELIGAE